MKFRTVTCAQARKECPELPSWALVDDDDAEIRIYAGNLALPSLDLDLRSADVGSSTQWIVKGDMSVARDILNADTEGAVSLAVLGDLRAANIAVGGQRVYVAGSLIVEGVCVGSYNHGDMAVAGGVSAACIILDDYSLAVGGQITEPVVASVENSDVIFRFDAKHGVNHKAGFHDVRITSPFVALRPNLLNEEGLDFGQLVAALRAGQPVVRDQFDDEASSCLVPIDPAVVYLNASNLRVLQASSLFAQGEVVLSVPGDPVVIITRAHDDEEGVPDEGSMYVVTGERAYFFSLEGDALECLLGDADADLKAPRGKKALAELERAFAQAWQWIRTLEAMQVQTPAHAIRDLVAALVQDGEDEFDAQWCSVARAIEEDEVGDRLIVLGPSERHLTFEVKGNVCLRYIDDPDGEDRFIVSIHDEALNRRCVAFFASAVAHLRACVKPLP